MHGVDLILGCTWLDAHDVTLDCKRRRATVHKGVKPRVLVADSQTVLPGAEPTPQQVMAYVGACIKNAYTCPIMTPKTAAKELARGARGHVVVIKDNVALHDAVPVYRGTWMCAPKSVGSLAAAHTHGGPVGDANGLVKPELVQQVLDEYKDVFEDLPPGLPPERGIGHAIPVQPGEKPPFRPMYRLSPSETQEMKTQIADLLAKGYVQPSTSPYGAPILFVGKKDGTLRMCVDYRALNKITVKNRYPLPRIDELFDKLQGRTVFSSLDLASGYHQIRITEEDRPKTAFRTPIGHFEFTVLCFGLTNAPSTFQKAMNDMFKDMDYVFVYLDDILIASHTAEQHVQHLRAVMKVLRENRFYAKLKKCEFNKPEVSFLGHTVGKYGLKVDEKKVAVVNDWPTPTKAEQVRSFVGLANYFRKFIQGFSSLVSPLITLMNKSPKDWLWSDVEQQAFDGIKRALTTAPVLALPDPDLPFEIISDASVLGTGGVLLQEGRPIAYTSKKFSKAEFNYSTGEQELLGILNALHDFRCYVEGVHFTLVTDHHPLTYLDTQSELSRRQARWVLYLQRFDYTWKYIPGRTNMADPLSRNPALLAAVTRAQEARARLQGAPERPLQGGAPTIELLKRAHGKQRAPPASGTVRLPSPETVRLPSQLQGAPEAATGNGQGQPVSNPPVPSPNPAPERVVDASRVAYEAELPMPPLIEEIIASYGKDPWFGSPARTQKLQRGPAGQWLRGAQIVVPNVGDLRDRVIYEFHDTAAGGHFGDDRTREKVERVFWWPGISVSVEEYVRACDMCQRNKTSTQKPWGLLKPLPIPEDTWQSVGIDLITQLPATKNGYDAIFVVVDRLSKMAHFAPVHTTASSRDLAEVFIDLVVKHHGLPVDIVSDRGPQFVSHFWSDVCGLWGTKQRLSTAYHPQSDGQTERMNRMLEDYLRHFVGPTQDDWDTKLALAEFAINDTFNASTGMTPFYMVYGKHPRSPATLVGTRVSRAPEAATFTERMQQIVKQARENIDAAQQRMRVQADEHRRECTIKLGDMVLLSTKNLKLKMVGTPKLMPKWVGPFKVTELVGQAAVRLDMPEPWRVHKVFHVSLVRPYTARGKVQPPPPVAFIDNEPLYSVERLLDRRERSKGGRKYTEYLIKWVGYPPEHNTWEPESHLEGCDELITEYDDMVRRAADRKRGSAGRGVRR
jgi:hypothetical protein